jgi:hypothetical protein
MRFTSSSKRVTPLGMVFSWIVSIALLVTCGSITEEQHNTGTGDASTASPDIAHTPGSTDYVFIELWVNANPTPSPTAPPGLTLYAFGGNTKVTVYLFYATPPASNSYAIAIPGAVPHFNWTMRDWAGSGAVGAYSVGTPVSCPAGGCSVTRTVTPQQSASQLVASFAQSGNPTPSPTAPSNWTLEAYTSNGTSINANFQLYSLLAGTSAVTNTTSYSVGNANAYASGILYEILPAGATAAPAGNLPMMDCCYRQHP